MSLIFFLEKEEKLDNDASNGAGGEGWVSPNKLLATSPKASGGHSRQGSNSSVNATKQKKWIDVVTGL